MSDCFVNTYHDDGGCDEGTSYWNVAGGALFDCLDQLHLASDGKIDFFTNELVRQIGRYISLPYCGQIFYQLCGRRCQTQHIKRYDLPLWHENPKDPDMIALAVGVPSNADFRAEPPRRSLPAIFNYEEFAGQKIRPPYIGDVWMDGIQVMVAREKEGSPEGLYLAAKEGIMRSHNHNDGGPA